MLMMRRFTGFLSALGVMGMLLTGCDKSGDDGPTGACVESGSGVVEGDAGSSRQESCVEDVNQTACAASSTSDGEYETTTEFYEGQSCDELDD